MLKKLNPQVQLKNLKELIITQLLEENSLLKKNLYQLDTKLKELQDGSNTKQKILKISGEIKDFEVLLQTSVTAGVIRDEEEKMTTSVEKKVKHR